MAKFLDWNAALSGDEDLNATMGSEVFRNFAHRVLAEEKREEEELVKQAEKKAEQPKPLGLDDLLKMAAADAVPSPFIPNKQYDGTYQDHVAETFEDMEKIELIPDNYEEIKQAEFEQALAFIKQANAEEAEKELGLDQNMYYLISKAKRNQ